MKKNRTGAWLARFGLGTLLILLGYLPVSAKNPFLDTERQYEPIVLYGANLALSGQAGSLVNAPIPELYLYAYDGASQQWHLIPFQIDERVLWQDALNPAVIEHYYFIADTLPGFDPDDELIFMARDLGDRAPAGAWIDNPESKSYPRLEIAISEPGRAELVAYAYLYRSPTLTEPIPDSYGFLPYDPNRHIIENNNYSVRLDEKTGLLADVRIKPPLGTGVDIFDTQKIRFAGLLDFGGLFGPIAIGRDGVPMADERNIGVMPESSELYYLRYTAKPMVRMVREARQALVFGQLFLDFSSFFVSTEFYPFSGAISGGAKLHPDSLKKEWETEEDWIFEFDLLRQSWDFSPDAAGMRFYNRYNQGVAMDGNPDDTNINKTIDIPIREWSLVTGNQGTMFTHLAFLDTMWSRVELYWYDNQYGGNGDNTYLLDGMDSGDTVSIGDQGIVFRGLQQNKVSLELGFTAYFLSGNLDGTLGAKMARVVEQPLSRSSILTPVVKTHSNSGPNTFQLYPNYPNPFNHSTRISFYLPQRENVTMTIFADNGRTVTTLANARFNSGYHTLEWDGSDARGQIVASGVYFCHFKSDHYQDFLKLLLLK